MLLQRVAVELPLRQPLRAEAARHVALSDDQIIAGRLLVHWLFELRGVSEVGEALVGAGRSHHGGGRRRPHRRSGRIQRSHHWGLHRGLELKSKDDGE